MASLGGSGLILASANQHCYGGNLNGYNENKNCRNSNSFSHRASEIVTTAIVVCWYYIDQRIVEATNKSFFPCM